MESALGLFVAWAATRRPCRGRQALPAPTSDASSSHPPAGEAAGPASEGAAGSAAAWQRGEQVRRPQQQEASDDALEALRRQHSLLVRLIALRVAYKAAASPAGRRVASAVVVPAVRRAHAASVGLLRLASRPGVRLVR